MDSLPDRHLLYILASKGNPSISMVSIHSVSCYSNLITPDTGTGPIGHAWMNKLSINVLVLTPGTSEAIEKFRNWVENKLT